MVAGAEFHPIFMITFLVSTTLRQRLHPNPLLVGLVLELELLDEIS